MFSISTVKVGTRLGFGYGIVLLLLVGITILGATRLSALNDNTQLIVHDRYAKVALFHEVIAEVNQVARTTRNIPLSKIQDVTVSASIGQRLLGFGDIVVDNASELGGTTVLKNINNPRHYADLLLRELRRWQ